MAEYGDWTFYLVAVTNTDMLVTCYGHSSIDSVMATVKSLYAYNRVEEMWNLRSAEIVGTMKPSKNGAWQHQRHNVDLEALRT